MATGGNGADVVFDLVGGVMFRSAVNSLALRGRLVEIAATGQREVSFDLADFYHNESRLYGVDTLKRDLTASAEVLEVLMPGFVAEDYRAAPISQICRPWPGAGSLSRGRGRLYRPGGPAAAGIGKCQR
jgi:NADPH:quinone reductase